MPEKPVVRARPGDVARAALRRAVAARRGGSPDADDTEDSDDGAVPDTGSGSAADGTSGAVPDAGSGSAADGTSGGSARDASAGGVGPGGIEQAGSTAEGGADRRGARPADVAREALRAARAEGRQARTDAGGEEAESTRRPRRTPAPASGARSGGPGRPAGVRARDVRELLEGAFQMPTTASLPGEEPTESGPAPSAEDPARSRHVNARADHPSSAERPSTPGPASAPSPQPETPETAAPLAPSAPPPYRTDTPTSAPTSPQHPPTTPAASPTSPPPPTDTHPPNPPAAPPRVPRSMAAPGRDGDLRRTYPAFPALPPRASGDVGFAETWWGNAWVAALEEGALDAKRLARGRAYAEQGHVDAITVTPGLVLAYVQGSRPRPYRVQVRLRTLDDADWERFLDSAADRPGHIAALLDKEMPHSLADSGVPLLPGPGDLEPLCSCPDSGHPCKHAAALCYQTARLLDADPFVLLLLRGRGERELLDALSRLSAARAARAAQEQGPAPFPGVRAGEVLASRQLPPLPAPLPVPPHPGQPPVYPATSGGPDAFALDQLATDAAARAHALLTTGRDPVGELTLWQDAVRLAAARPGSGLTAGTRALYSSLASAVGRTPAELARAVAAWRQGGLEGLSVLEEPWDPPAGRFDRARPLLLAADLPAFRPWRNHLTHPRGHVQLRLGRDGLWYAYESEPGHDDWWPRGTPDLDPVGALTGLGTPSDLSTTRH
ncbi:SWIM zinc finger family protein [Streptomyces sp. NPDC050619]|uniref:SWIM zinc finger family protein n=1 Tax=Streptomyces sp. NPDC050619 TaxID=3157214 RepID=UPI00342B927D